MNNTKDNRNKILNAIIENKDRQLELKLSDSIKSFLKKSSLDDDDLTILVELFLHELAFSFDKGYKKGYDQGVEDEINGNVFYSLNYDNPDNKKLLKKK